MTDVTKVHCPAVPDHGSGTAGQCGSATDMNGTACGTAGGTLSLKALGRLVLERDKARDSVRDSAEKPTVGVSRSTLPIRGASGTLSGQGAPWVCWL